MKTKEAEQIPTISVDCGFFGQPDGRAHDTLPVLIVQDRKSKGIWSHPVPSKGVTHPYPARTLMTELDFMVYKRVILKSDQEPSIVALCDAVKNGWHGEITPEESLPRARARATERSSVRSNLCTHLREPQRLLGATIWNYLGVSKPVVGLAGGALFQSSPALPQG